MSQVTFEPRQAKSRAAVRQPKRQLVPQTVEERIIYALKSYRAKIAQAENVPPYIVFTDKTLTEIARQKPIDLKGLQRISGIGEVKLVNYGRQLIGTVRKELGMNAMITGFSDDLTYYLVDKKYDIKSFRSYPNGQTAPRKGAFKLQNATADVTKEIKKGYYVIIDTVGLTNEHLFELKAALEEMGYSEYILWYY